MAPKPPKATSKRVSQGSSQRTSLLSGAVDKLVAKLTAEGETNGTIKNSADIVNPASEALRAYRRSSIQVEAPLINSILPLLDSGEGEICSRLDAQLYSIVIQIFLQAGYSRQVERGMHLLAAALYYDSQSELNGRLICKKKEAIGKECLLSLLEFFIDKVNNDSMRRWVGLAFLQLLKGCEANVEKIEIASEDMRRSLGSRLLEEKNEILRSIFGRIIREILDSGVEHDHLWPVGTSKELYATFPESTKDWNSKFQEYTDETIDPNSSEYLSFWAQHVQTEPVLKFGPKGHNTAVSLEPHKLVLWAGAAPDTTVFDQSIEIPYAFIKGVTIKPRTESQDFTALAHLHLEIENDKDNFCYMDCIGTVIHQTMMVMRLHELLDVVKNLDRRCPSLDIDDETRMFGIEIENEDLNGTGSEESPRRTHSQSDPVGFPAAVHSGVSAREIPETQIDDLPPGENGDEFELAADLDGDEDFVNEPKIPTKQLTTTTTSSRKGKTGMKPKAKTSLVKSLRPKQALPESPVMKAKSRIPMEEGKLGRPEEEKAKASIAKRGARSPATVSTQRREARATTYDDLADARAMFYETNRRSPTEHSVTGSHEKPQRQRVTRKSSDVKATETKSSLNSNVRPKESFESDGITTPGTNDASTPKFVTGGKVNTIRTMATQKILGNKKMPKYTLKMKTPLLLAKPGGLMVNERGKSKAENQEAKQPTPIPKPVANTVKDKGKPKVKEPNDPFDIPQDDEEFHVKVPSEGATRSAMAKAKAGKGIAKQPKVDPKKRKSALAALQQPVAATRNRRAVAVTASWRMLGADASDNEDEAAEDIITSSRKPKATLQAKKRIEKVDKLVNDQPQSFSQKRISISKSSTSSSHRGDDDTFERQQKDARALGLSHDDVAALEIDDLYGASPEPRVVANEAHLTKGRQNATTKRSTKSLGDLEPNTDGGGLHEMASNLDTLLCGLGEPAEDEEDMPPPRLVTKAQAKETLVTVTDEGVVEQNVSFKVRKEHVVEQAKGEQDQIESAPQMIQTRSAKRGGKTSTGNKSPQPQELPTRKRKARPVTKKGARGSQSGSEVANRASEETPVPKSEPRTASARQDPIFISDDESSESGAVSEEGDILEDVVLNDSEQEQPEEPNNANESQQESNSSKKRKMNEDRQLPRKKKRSAKAPKTGVGETPLRKSSGRQDKANTKQPKSPITKRKAQPPKLPTRFSPRLAARAINTSGIASAHKNLVDDRLARKGTVISFNENGPRNQGPTSVGTSAKALRKSEPTEKAVAPQETEWKRKRKPVDTEEGEETLFSMNSPPTKRRSISPGDNPKPNQLVDELVASVETPRIGKGTADRYQAATPHGSSRLFQDGVSCHTPGSPRNDDFEVEAVTGAEQGLSNGPPSAQSQVPQVEKALPSSPPEAQSHIGDFVVCEESVIDKSDGLLRGRHSKQSSQVSRVDQNGSPIASYGPQVDHIGKAKRNLLEDAVPHAKGSFSGRDATSQASPGTLGSRVILTSIPRARPRSPAGEELRYIPHNRMDSGTYEGVATKQVVEPEKKLADPFMGQEGRHTSDFTERLLASASKTYNQNEMTHFLSRGATTPRENPRLHQAHLPPHPAKPVLRTGLKANGNSRIQKKTARIVIEDAEKTLVNSENEPPSEDNPSDMTSGASNESLDNEKESPSQHKRATNEMWNFALRPHYSTLSDAIRRIAEEVIIRLSDEEDTLDLLVDQYEENGNKILTNLVQDRDKQKKAIEQQLGSKRQDLVKIFQDAKDLVNKGGESKRRGEELSMEAFDKQWRREQGEVQKNIDRARRKLDG